MFPVRKILFVAISAVFPVLTSCPGFAKECEEFPRFEEYPAKEDFKGKPAAPKFVTQDTRMFRTAIKEGAKAGPDFAGHYTVVVVGCGTSCGRVFIVDAKSGKVFDQVDIDITGHNQPELPPNVQEQFRLDSRLMISFRPKFPESPDEAEQVLQDDLLFYEWVNDEFHLICEKRGSPRQETQGNGAAPTEAPPYGLPKDSPDRKGIMDALRVAVKNMSDLDVIFVVSYLKAKDGWAWVAAEPMSADGENHFETVSGLLQKKEGRWILLEGPPEEECEENTDCADSSRYFRKLTEKYPSLPPAILPE